jgi:hypothetical protein
MPELAPEIVFGAGTTQSPTTFTLSKAGVSTLLANAGYTFTPKDVNSADELMAAIICCGLVSLTPAAREADPANRNIEFDYDPTLNFDTTNLGGITYNRHVVDVRFYKAIPTPKLNPSDY